MLYIFGGLIFILGICVGSFLNVLIIRLAEEKKITGRSRCAACGRCLPWHDLVPVLSFFWLGRKCRWCRKKISWQYPLVEIATGLIFLFLAFFIWQSEFGSWDSFGYWTGGWQASIGYFFKLFYFYFISSCLVVVFVSDLKYFIIPDEIVIAGCAGALAYKFFDILSFQNKYFSAIQLPAEAMKISNFGLGIFQPLGYFVLAALGASLFFMSIVILTKGKGMGLGDVKFALLMGLILGWPNILAGLLLAFAAGAIFGLILILFGRASMKSELPFGVFLAASAFFVMVFSAQFGRWLGPLFG